MLAAAFSVLPPVAYRLWPLLLVVPREGRAIDRDDLLRIYEGKVAKWWRPDDVVVVDSLPHTATGKLSKVTLRQRYRDHLLVRQTSVADTA